MNLTDCRLAVRQDKEALVSLIKGEVVVNSHDLKVEVDINLHDLINGTIFLSGEFNQPETGSFIITQRTDGQVQFVLTGKNNTNNTLRRISPTYGGTEISRLRVENGEIYLNDVLEHTFDDFLMELDLSIPVLLMSNAQYTSNADADLYRWNIQDEEFFVTDIDLNAQIKGSQDTIASVLTNKAGGNDYILNEILQGACPIKGSLIDLKDLKRLGNDVTPSVSYAEESTNNPVFRQNGYQLTYNDGNGDYQELGAFTDANIDFTITTELNGDDSQIFITNRGDSSNGFNLSIRDTNSSGASSFVLNGVTNTFLTNVPSGQGVAEYRIVFDEVTIKIYINGILHDNRGFSHSINTSNAPLRYCANVGSDGGIGGYTPNQLTKLITINGEEFDPVNIDSNGQILGSNGTVSSVFTSESSGTDYVLGTVFQKFNFALELDGNNNEAITYPRVAVNNLSEVNLKIHYKGDGNYYGSNQEILFFVGFTARDAIYISRVNETQFQIIIYVTGSGSTQQRDFVYSEDAIIEIKNLEIRVNGNLEITLNEETFPNGLNYPGDEAPTHGYTGTVGSKSAIFSILEGSYQGNELNLTRGLGNNDGSIITSHADPQQRINFGMWLKGNDYIGYYPYGDKEYYLQLNRDNADNLIQLPKSYDLTSFKFGVTVNVDSLSFDGFHYLLSKGGSDISNRFAIVANDTLNSVSFVYYNGQSIDIQNFDSQYSGWVTIECEYGADNTHRIYVNGEEKGSATEVNRPDINVSRFCVGGLLNSDTSTDPASFSLISADISSYYTGDDLFLLNTGKGFVNGNTENNLSSTGQTSVADPLNYWNTTVWKELV